ncbi:hypothetical protein KCU64_g43, partial [Aureobasidium melanogenum]
MLDILGLDGLCSLSSILLFVVLDTRLLDFFGVDRLGLVITGEWVWEWIEKEDQQVGMGTYNYQVEHPPVHPATRWETTLYHSSLWKEYSLHERIGYGVVILAGGGKCLSAIQAELNRHKRAKPKTSYRRNFLSGWLIDTRELTGMGSARISNVRASMRMRPLLGSTAVTSEKGPLAVGFFVGFVPYIHDPMRRDLRQINIDPSHGLQPRLARCVGQRARDLSKCRGRHFATADS